MKKNVIIFTTVIFSCFLSPTYGQWGKYIIDNNLYLATCVAVGDIDDNNIPDVLATSFQANKVNWYENNHPEWVKHSIDANLDGSAAVQVGDIDNDGDLDIVATAYDANDVVWYENPTWTKHTIDANLTNVVHMMVADIDNDDTLDVIAAGYHAGGDIVWYENNHPTWNQHSIAPNWGQIPAIHVCDIDGDENPDVLATGDLADKVAWFRNENNGLSWTEYTIDDNLNGAWYVFTGDIDNNDTIDVIATGELANDVVWYKNNHPAWTKYTIDSNLIRAKCFEVFDIDDDEKPDVVAVGFTSNGKVVWYKNNYPDPWEKLVIDPSCNEPNYPVISDIDGDKAPDVVVAVEGGGNVVWYKNPYTTVAYATSFEFSPYFLESVGDTFTFNASVINPENHPLELSVLYQGDQTDFIDSLQLFDDGLHYDSDSADNIWGNKSWLSGLPEDALKVKLATYDLNLGTKMYFNAVSRIINFGPVILENYAFSGSDVEPNPGDRVKIELTLKNYGSTATAKNITAELISLDPLVSVLTGSKTYDDIPAGENSTPETYTTKISDECPGNKEILIAVNISSYGQICWIDTFSIFIEPPVNIKNIAEPITRIYPNPTDNILNIELSNAGSQGIEIEILDMIGTLIYQKESTSSGPHFDEQLDLSGYAKGIYLLKVRQADRVYYGKVVVR
jgi:hypothetical protein